MDQPQENHNTSQNNVFETVKKNKNVLIIFAQILAGFAVFALTFFLGLVFTNTGERSDTLESIDDEIVSSTISASNEYFIRQDSVVNSFGGDVIISYELSIGLTEECAEGTCYIKSRIAESGRGEDIGGPTKILRDSVAAYDEVEINRVSIENLYGTIDIEGIPFTVVLEVEVYDDNDTFLGVVEGEVEEYVYE